MSSNRETLRQAGIAVTPQRLAIANTLFERHQHLTADEVYMRVNQADDRVSRATVYNTLGLFSSKGLVNEICVDATRTFYDTNVEPHFHLYNVDTNTLTDVVVDPVLAEGLGRLVPSGHPLQGVDVVVRIHNAESS